MKSQIFWPFLSLLFVPFFAQGESQSGLSASQLLSQDPPKEVLQNEVFTLKPASQHYFNLEAPQKCSQQGFVESSPRYLKCQLNQPGQHEVKVAVCDDKKTYCRFHSFKVEAKAAKNWKGQDRKAQVVYQPRSQRQAVKGFLDNEPEKALNLAQKKQQLLLIDFYGIWCPPCNLLDELVYETPQFVKATEDMVKISLDADSDLSWKWKDHFHVRGYPTVVIADAKLREIGRMVGYKDLEAVLNWVNEQKSQAQFPVELLASRPLSKVSAVEGLRVARWYYERGEYQKVKDYLKKPGKKGSQTQLLFLQSELALLRAQEKASEVQAILKRLVKDQTHDIEFASWVMELQEQKAFSSKAQAGHLKDARRQLALWRASPQRAETGYTLHDLYGVEGSLLEAFDKKEEAMAAYSLAAEAAKKLVELSHLKVARGANLDRAYYLYKAGKLKESKELYTQLVSHYPKEFTFNYNFAYVLRELKEFEEAVKYAQKAEQQAYGDNWLRAVGMLARIELARKNKEAAQKMVEKALQETVMPASTQVRTHRYLAQLRDLAAEIKKN